MGARSEGAKNAPEKKRKRYRITGISFKMDHWEFLAKEEEEKGICPSVFVRILIEREIQRRAASAS